MDKFSLNTGFEMPLIGLGTYLIKGTDLTNKVIDDALSVGYRLFDTAQMYNNEQYLGAAFKTLLPKHNLSRQDIFITSKFSPSTDLKTDDDYLEMIRESLQKLQTDYIDLMLIHWPGVDGLSSMSRDVVKYRNEAWKALIKFKEQGLIRSIGVSNFLIRHIEEVKKESGVTPAVNQVEFQPLCYDLEMLEYCKKNGILLQAHSSLGTSGSNMLRNNEIIKSIANELGKSSTQILLRWSFQRQVAIIPKARSKNHLEENLDLNFEIPLDKMKILDDMIKDNFTRFDWDPNDVI